MRLTVTQHDKWGRQFSDVTKEVAHRPSRFDLNKVRGGLVMDTVTNPFALYNLQEAYEELCRAYGSGEGVALPEVPDTIGGSKVDVMVGIKYLAFFPELVFTLPSGLAIYESQIRTVCGRRGVIGGPHKSWAHAEERIEFMSSLIIFLKEILTEHRGRYSY